MNIWPHTHEWTPTGGGGGGGSTTTHLEHYRCKCGATKEVKMIVPARPMHIHVMQWTFSNLCADVFQCDCGEGEVRRRP